MSHHGGGAQTDVHALEHNCRRVTAEDVAAVTDADVRAVLATMTPDEYRAALRVLVANNKIGDVINNSEPDSFRAALGGLDAGMVTEAGDKVRGQPPAQASLLAATTDTIRAACADAWLRIRRPGSAAAQ